MYINVYIVCFIPQCFSTKFIRVIKTLNQHYTRAALRIYDDVLNWLWLWFLAAEY